MKLARGVHACVDDDTAIFLDLCGNRYVSALVRAHGRAPERASERAPQRVLVPERVPENLQALDPSAAGRTAPAASAPLAAFDVAQLRALSAAGLLEPAPPALDPDLEEAIGAAPGLVRPGDWLRFCRGWLWARKIAASKRLDLGLAELTRLGFSARGAAENTLAFALSANERFERMRPFAPAARVCLLDSLALAHFLLSQGLRISLVFGVRVRPFGAHCWVEWAGHPLNDRGGHARFYQEILRARL